MIDILGMMLPGAILLLLFGEEFEFLLYLAQRIGSDEPPTAIITVVLLIGGYMVGMLLHEIGDMIEKIIWHNPLLNPRTYAAFSTGLYEKEKGRNDNTIDKK